MSRPKNRTLRCPDGAELLLRVPKGSLVIVLARESDGDVEVELRRGHLEGRDASAVSDLRLEKALRAMNGAPNEPWTVETLAERAGMSRSAFANAFAAATGETPLAYLTRARLELTARLLAETSSSLAEIAHRVGYANEFALSRAFKRQYGIAPTPFRKSLAAYVPSRLTHADRARCAA